MAIYRYSCKNEKCNNKDKEIEIWKSMKECDREEYCKCCGELVTRTVSSLVCGLSCDKTNSFYRKNN